MSSSDSTDAFVDNLLAWYEKNGRHELPWRAQDASPFEVLVAELMLQKTSAGQVLDVYEDFVEKYPSPESLLEVPEHELADDIGSLGLRKRSRYFREASERLVENYEGTVPDNRSELLELHGVGEYSAASVLAHAFGKDVAAVDTNVARILSRAFGLSGGEEARAEENWRLAQELLPAGRSSDFTHALIDLGAEVCTPADPDCENCPVESTCEHAEE